MSTDGSPAEPGREAAHEVPAADAAKGYASTATRGVLFMTVQKWVTRLGGLVTIAILTRLLGPAEFGVVAAAMAVIPVVYLLADLGFSTYVVQAERADDVMLSTNFWYSTAAGLLLGGAFYLGAPTLAALFDVPGVEGALRGLVPCIVLVALQGVPIAILRRRMQFGALAVQGATAAVVAQVVAVVLAFAGAGVWALIGQQIVSQLVSGVLAWRAARWRPRAHFSLTQFRAMSSFGAKVVGVELVAIGRGLVETAIITHSLGVTALGFLSVARRLVETTQDLSAAAILPVSAVVFAKVRDTPVRLRAAYRRSLTGVYATVGLPLAFLAVGSGLAVPIVFGDGWDTSVPLTRALAIAAVLVVGASLDQGLLYGAGRPGRWFAYALGVDVLTVATTAYVVRYGLVWVPTAFVGVALVATIARWFVVARALDGSVASVAAPFVRVLPIVAGSSLVGIGMLRLVDGLPALVGLALVGVAMALVHLLLMRVVARGVLEDVIDGLRLRQVLGRLFPRAAAAGGSDRPRP